MLNLNVSSWIAYSQYVIGKFSLAEGTACRFDQGEVESLDQGVGLFMIRWRECFYNAIAGHETRCFFCVLFAGIVRMKASRCAAL